MENISVRETMIMAICYLAWNRKEENFQSIKELYGQIDFQLLLNEHTYISKSDDRIALVGVENWGITLRKQEILIKLRRV
jgi:hypothetical protein